ncbi:hypothetical protein Ae201684_007258 [Aphanomyces euteiches]|uniref:Uncharacterized protein n=1 Tax=Aphanomyces euteiches TaxID=100861 RepID=A0A6G0X855_9STRA|nr:hypothetical protein Ae201684_007258 [Aphanomyces euteiches]
MITSYPLTICVANIHTSHAPTRDPSRRTARRTNSVSFTETAPTMYKKYTRPSADSKFANSNDSAVSREGIEEYPSNRFRTQTRRNHRRRSTPSTFRCYNFYLTTKSSKPSHRSQTTTTSRKKTFQSSVKSSAKTWPASGWTMSSNHCTKYGVVVLKRVTQV